MNKGERGGRCHIEHSKSEARTEELIASKFMSSYAPEPN